MRAIELLMNEHRTIERTLDAMEKWVDRVRCKEDHREQEALGGFVSFLREFVDDRHHGKEEDILFASMIEHGVLREQGPIALILHEHDLGRSLVDTLAILVRQATPWNDEDRRHLEKTVRAYTKMLREHIRKEDMLLYPLARRGLPGPVKQEISRRFLGEVLFEDLTSSHLLKPEETSK